MTRMFYGDIGVGEPRHHRHVFDDEVRRDPVSSSSDVLGRSAVQRCRVGRADEPIVRPDRSR